jgi:hypothetical protein
MLSLRRFQASCTKPRSRRRVETASRGVRYPAESCLYRRTGPVGLARSRNCLVVSDGPMWSSGGTVPLHLAKQGSSSRELRSPSESLPAVTCPGALPPRTPSLGSLPSSRHQLAESTHRRRSQRRLRSALDVSHVLDGLLLCVPCALVSSRCRVQGSRSRGFLPRSGRITSSVTVTLSSLAVSPAGFPAPANVASTSGSCSEPWSAVSGGCFKPARHSCPLLRFQLLRVRARGPGVHRRALSARDLHDARLRVPRVAGPQRIDQSPCCGLSPKRPVPFELSCLRSRLPFPTRPIGIERLVATADGRSL